MALHFEINSGLRQGNFDIEKLLSENMAFGVYENAYFLKAGVIGSPTVIFDEKRIGRGVEVDVKEGILTFDSPVPSTNADVELLFRLIQRAIELTGAENLVFQERTVECGLLKDLKDGIKNIHQKGLDFFGDVLEDEKEQDVLIYGATQVVAIGREKIKKIMKSWNEYEDYLHQVQEQDLYFAKPMFLQNDEGILGLYVLTSGVRSSFPLEKSFLVDTDQIDVSQWCVGFCDLEAEDMLGMISYDDFLAGVDTTDMLDAARFVVELDVDQMKDLVEKYGAAL